MPIREKREKVFIDFIKCWLLSLKSANKFTSWTLNHLTTTVFIVFKMLSTKSLFQMQEDDAGSELYVRLSKSHRCRDEGLDKITVYLVSCNCWFTFHEINKNNTLFVWKNGKHHFSIILRRLVKLTEFWEAWIALLFSDDLLYRFGKIFNCQKSFITLFP